MIGSTRDVGVVVRDAKSGSSGPDLEWTQRRRALAGVGIGARGGPISCQSSSSTSYKPPTLRPPR